MNKKSLILAEAKRLFGRYGYLGFTLKQLAKACEMTSPALYYFYSGKADLFRDCVLSEIQVRQELITDCIAHSHTLGDFADRLAHRAIEVCSNSDFRVGEAMREVIHLPEAMQEELRDAWYRRIIAPVEGFLVRALPERALPVNGRLMATFFVCLATFSAVHHAEFGREELVRLFTAVAQGLEAVSLALPTAAAAPAPQGRG